MEIDDERIKCLLDLVEWYKNNFNPENGGILDETITYLQSFQRQLRELECLLPLEGADLQRGQVIESSAPQGDAFVSNPHVNEQEITQIREQNTNFGSTLNQGINMRMKKKRKLRSTVWNHFIRYENEDKEMKARCNYCKRDFNEPNKSGTTPLRNHLKSCSKIQHSITDKMKELNVVDQELNHSNSLREFIKYGWDKNIKDNIMKVYMEEKDKLHRYLDNFSGRFNVTIGNDIVYGVEFVKIWFIDDKWKLKTKIIHLKNYDGDEETLNEDSLKDLIQDWNIDERILSIVDHRDREESLEDLTPQLTNQLNKRVSLPIIGNYETNHHLLFNIEYEVDRVECESGISSEVRKLKEYYMTSSNKYKEVESNYDDVRYLYGFKLLDWAMGYKEVFCELKRTDPNFPPSNFDWDDATLLHSFWAAVEDMKNDIRKLGDSKLANECFPMVRHLFSKMLQFKNTENQYFRPAALRCREIFVEYCNNIEIVITAILDPRFKRKIVEDFFEKIMDDVDEVFENEGGLHFEKIMDDVTNIYNEYARAYANEAASSKSEFERYLADPMVSSHERLDILEWWRKNSPTYPTLAAMARDFLSIPIVNALDMYFEDGFAVIYRSMDFNVDLKDVLAYTKDWLKDHDCM